MPLQKLLFMINALLVMHALSGVTELREVHQGLVQEYENPIQGPTLNQAPALIDVPNLLGLSPMTHRVFMITGLLCITNLQYYSLEAQYGKRQNPFNNSFTDLGIVMTHIILIIEIVFRIQANTVLNNLSPQKSLFLLMNISFIHQFLFEKWYKYGCSSASDGNLLN